MKTYCPILSGFFDARLKCPRGDQNCLGCGLNAEFISALHDYLYKIDDFDLSLFYKSRIEEVLNYEKSDI